MVNKLILFPILQLFVIHFLSNLFIYFLVFFKLLSGFKHDSFISPTVDQSHSNCNRFALRRICKRCQTFHTKRIWVSTTRSSFYLPETEMSSAIVFYLLGSKYTRHVFGHRISSWSIAAAGNLLSECNSRLARARIHWRTCSSFRFECKSVDKLDSDLRNLGDKLAHSL